MNYPIEKIANVTLEEALNHPNWDMGDKITIDSATMMNKGLEVIEAFYLFNLPKSKIDVIIHPQSIIHSMVEFVDGSLISQLGYADMRIPISYALGYPDRLNSGFNGIDLTKVEKLTFFKPDLKKFPSLKLAYNVLEKNLSHSIVLNLSNELSVHAFLNKLISFDKIPQVVDFMLNKIPSEKIVEINDIFLFSEYVIKETKNYLFQMQK